jgi:hypothetical protein
MAVRRELTRARRLSDQVIDQLREVVQGGVPWRPDPPSRGYSDLIFLITGHFYFPEFIHDSGDIETAKEIWSELREDILVQHARQQRPVRNRIFDSVRPWAWWALEDRDSRRRLSRKTCTCWPGSKHPGLPPLTLSWFGHPRGCRCEYESEEAYLARLGLLTPAEEKQLRAEA